MAYWFYIAIAYGSALLSAGITISSKILTQNFSPFTLTFFRFAISTLCLLPLVRLQQIKNITLKSAALFMLLGFWGIFFANYLYLTGMKETTAINASIITSLVPILVLLLYCVLHSQRPTTRQLIAFMISSFGVMMIVTNGNFTSVSSISIGDFYILGSALCWASFGITVKLLSTQFSTIFITFLTNAISLAFTLPMINHSELLAKIPEISIYQWILIFYMGALGTAANYFLYAEAMTYLGPPLAAFIIYSNIPLFVVMLSYLLLHEPLMIYQFFGILLIIFALYLSQNKSAPLKSTTEH